MVVTQRRSEPKNCARYRCSLLELQGEVGIERWLELGEREMEGLNAVERFFEGAMSQRQRFLPVQKETVVLADGGGGPCLRPAGLGRTGFSGTHGHGLEPGSRVVAGEGVATVHPGRADGWRRLGRSVRRGHGARPRGKKPQPRAGYRGFRKPCPGKTPPVPSQGGAPQLR